MDEPTTSKQVEESVKKAIEDGALQQAEFEFGKARILFSKQHRLEDLPALDDPAEYPDVPTKLKDDADSWLK